MFEAIYTAPFSAEATAPVCYGPGASALGACLMARRHLPVERSAEATSDWFGRPGPDR